MKIRHLDPTILFSPLNLVELNFSITINKPDSVSQLNVTDPGNVSRAKPTLRPFILY